MTVHQDVSHHHPHVGKPKGDRRWRVTCTCSGGFIAPSYWIGDGHPGYVTWRQAFVNALYHSTKLR